MRRAAIRLFESLVNDVPGRDNKWSVGLGCIPFRHIDPLFFYVFLQHGERREDGTFEPLYIHPYRFEGAGGAFLPIKDGKIGLQRRERMQTRDMGEYLAAFPYEIRAMIATLGRDSYEVPRGYGDFGEDGGQTAVREASEETGCRVMTTHALEDMCANTSQEPHMISLHCGILGASFATEDPDRAVNILPEVEYFDLKGLARLRREGLLYCGITLSTIAAYQLASIADPSTFPPLR